jgi:hypothetical protein
LFRSARDGQANLATEGCEARIVLVAQDEGVEEHIRHARIAAGPRSIEPLEGCLRVVAKRIDLSDLIGLNAGILFDQRLERRFGGSAVVTDLVPEALVAPR